jgi:branched-chain amino acid transport system substrate-binding protein
MIAYGIAANGSNPITGVNIAKGLTKLVGGTEKIDVGPARLGAGVAALSGGGSVDLNGTSGPLDFDPSTGEARSDIAVWCLRVDPNTTNIVYGDATGQTYNATENKLNGTFNCQ